MTSNPDYATLPVPDEKPPEESGAAGDGVRANTSLTAGVTATLLVEIVER